MYYRGVTTGTIYSYLAPGVVPQTLLDGNGNPLPEATYNGELVITCNRDGSMARGTIGPPPPTDIYAPGWIQSLWEKAPEPEDIPPRPSQPATLPSPLPMSLGFT